MATLESILDRKGRDVTTIEPDATVTSAAQEMNQGSIGGLIVMEGNTVVGVFTERDILRRVVAVGRDPSATPVRDVMTTAVVSCPPDATIDACRALMTERRLRHVPIVGPSGLCGIVTSGDILAFQVADQQDTIDHLTSYVQGRT